MGELEIYRIEEDPGNPGFFFLYVLHRLPKKEAPSYRLYTIDPYCPDRLAKDFERENPGFSVYYDKDSLEFITPEEAVLHLL